MVGLGASQLDGQFGAAAQQTSNNTTVQHERPSEASESGDTAQVSQWLERRLANQLQGSAVSISQGQYDQARGILGEGYSSRLDQYVSVAGETDTDSDDQTTERYESTQQTQREYANATQEYRDTYDRYERAREAGNATAARQAGRELERQSDRIQQLNSSLQREYETLENLTDVDTERIRRPVANVTANITAQQATVRAQTFVETNLTVRTNESVVGFNDPSTISGQIRLANGTVLKNVSGRLVVADRVYRVSTDTQGQFSVSYRPILLPVGATTAPVQFLPANASVYLGSADVVSVNVTQVSPTLETAVVPTRGGYEDQIGTTVVATVDGRPVPSLPIRATLGTTVVSGRTDDSGRVSLSPRVPAGLPAGERSLRVAQPRSDIAVGPNVSVSAVTITETETELTVTATTDDGLRTRGRLRTVDGASLAGQRIQLTVGGTTRSVETNATGWYRLVVANVSAIERSGDGDITVTARFDGSGTNLGDGRAETTVRLATTSDAGDSTTPLVLGGMVLGVLVVAGVVGWSRWQGSSETNDTQTPAPATTPHSTTSPEQSVRWLDRARSALTEDDDERAIVTAYGAVRRHLEREASLASTLTHREFVTAAETGLSEADGDALSTVATAYEEVTFQGIADGSAAEATVEAATKILPDSEPSTV